MIRLISLCCGIYFIVSPVVQAQCNIIASQLRHEYGKVRFQDTEPTGQVQWQQLPARQVQYRCGVMFLNPYISGLMTMTVEDSTSVSVRRDGQR